MDRPLRTLTTLDRFGLVEWDRGAPTLRMLQPTELMKAMGFDKNFILPESTRRNQVKVLGNGVCPPVMEKIVRGIAKEYLRKRGRIKINGRRVLSEVPAIEQVNVLQPAVI